MTTVLERRLAQYIATGEPFTADDITAAGMVSLDHGHTPNARQNGIGALFNTAARQGHIVFTGTVVRSTAPHRKGGMIRVWQGTPAGRRWADAILHQGHVA